MKSTWKRALATLLTIAMMATLLVVPAFATETGVYEVNFDGNSVENTYFTSNGGTGVSARSKTITEGEGDDAVSYSSSYAYQFGGATKSSEFTTARSVSFTTTYPNATIKLWFENSNSKSERELAIWDSKGALSPAVQTASLTGAAGVSDELTLSSAGTYYIVAPSGDLYIHKIVVVDKAPAASEDEMTLTFAVDEGLSVTNLTVGDEAKSYAASVNVAKNTAVTFKVATASDLYEVKEVKFGDTVLTAAEGVYTIEDVGDAAATVTITANSSRVAASAVTLSQETLELEVGGEAATLTASVEPDNTTDELEVKSSNVNVAKWENGTVSPVAIGKATITATAGDQEATCEVSVVGADQNGPVYIFNAGNMGEGSLPDGTVAYDNYFTVKTKGSAVTADPRTFGTSSDTWYLSGTKYLAPGTDGNKDQRSVVFTTTADKSTVEVWWKQNASGDATPVQRDISLDGVLASGLIGSAVDGVGEGATAFVKNNLYHVTFSNVAAGDHYVAAANGGGEYIFQIVVTETEEETVTKTDLSTKTVTLDKTAPVVGDTLTASVEGVTATDVDFIWTVGDTEVTDNKTATYTVAAADMGKVIKVKAQAKVDSTTYEKATEEVSTSAVVGQTMTVTATGYTGAYDAQPHGITVSGAPTGATVEYSTDGSTWSATAPTFTNVADTPATVNYKVTATGYAEATGSATVTITKAAAPTITVKASLTGDIPAAQTDVTFTATGVPKDSAAVLTGHCTQAEADVNITFAWNTEQTVYSGVSHVAENTEETEKIHTVTFTWPGDDNYEAATSINTVTLHQVGKNSVGAAAATGLAVDNAFADKGVTATASDVDGVAITVDEAAILAAFAADKAAFNAAGVLHGTDAYIPVSFDAPADFDKATWTVQQFVNGTASSENPWKLDGSDSANELNVGEGKIIDWFGILKGVTGDAPTMPEANTYEMRYRFYNGNGDLAAITYYTVERAVTAAPVEYTVTVNAGENGTATASVEKAVAGTEVTLTITPATGYEVDAITSDDVTVADNKFNMPEKNVTINVTFKAEQGEQPPVADLTPAGELAEGEYRMSIKGEGAGGTVNCADGVIAGLAWNEGARMHADHGMQGVTAFAVKVPDGKTATVTVITCTYGTGTPITVTKGTATVGASEAIVGSEKDGDTKTVITGVTGTAQFALDTTQSNYVHCIKVEFEGGETVDKTGLTAAVTAAEAALAEAAESVDGSDVATDKTWITAADKATLEAAIAAAKALGETATQADVDAAKAAVESAAQAIKAGTKTEAPVVDKTALKADIAAAEKLVEDTAITAQEDNLAGEKYWDSAMKTAYEAAIAEAKAVADKADATADDVAAAKTALADATTAFKAGKTDGTKVLEGDELAAALADAITAATDAKAGVEANDATDPSEVTSGTKYVPTEVMDALEDALKAAEDLKALLDDEDAENDPAAEALTEALVALKNATKDFKPVTGTKSSGSNYRPSGNGGIVNNPAKTETLGDGTTVTTTTDSKGNTTVVTKRPDGLETTTVTSKDGDVTITTVNAENATVAEVKIPAAIPANDQKFVDVPEGHWAEASINNMAALNMVKGVDDVNHIFDMNSDVTRGAVATILFRFSNGKEGLSQSFSDVAEDQWYTDAVAWASNAGVVTGFENGTFQPDGSITREQLAVMIYRYAKLIGLDVSAKGDLAIFTDGDQVQNWAVDGMAWCVKSGIINGRGDGTVDPTTAATRAEAAAMLDRFVGLLK